MVKRLREKVILTPSDIKASSENLKVIGVFNPGAVRFGEDIILLARIAEAPIEEKTGFISSPRIEFNGISPKIAIDWINEKDNISSDPRGILLKNKLMRLRFISYLRLIRLDATGFEVKEIDEGPTFYPQEPYEEFGVEDPRITMIDGVYYFTYVAVSRKLGIATAIARTSDFKTYERLGIIFPTENKDVVILPDKINGEYVSYHRPVSANPFSNPNMQIAYSPDLIHWGRYDGLLYPRDGYWDEAKIGAGPPPIKTKHGFLEIYHGVKIDEHTGVAGKYCAGAALFDLNDPGKLLARSVEPILVPEGKKEKEGFVPDVIFPTGALLDKNEENIIIFSGGADTVVTVTEISLKDVMDSLADV